MSIEGGAQLKQKKWALMVLATALALQSHVAAVDFSDFPSDWSAAPLTRAVEDGLLTGTGGKINGNGKLTRAEMATIVNRAFGASAKASLDAYTDVPDQAWYYTEMAKAVQMGTFQGSGNQLFPDAEITREQAFTVLARAFLMPAGNPAHLNAFSDGDQVSPWAQSGVAALIEGGCVHGADGKLNPQSGITRAEFAQVMCNLVGTYVSMPETVTQTEAGNLMVRTAGATLRDLTVDGDLVLGDGLGAGEITLEQVNVQGRLLVRGGGEESIYLTGVEVADGVVLTNANTPTRIVTKDSSLGPVEVHSALIVEGDMDEVHVAGTASITVRSGKVGALHIAEAASDVQITVEKGAQVDHLTVNGPSARVDGKGTVKTVQANADNLAVATPNTKVVVSKDVAGVTVGGKQISAGQTVQTTASGSVSGGKSGNAGSGSSSHPGDTGTTETTQYCTARMIDLSYAQYVVLTFAEGSTVTDYTVAIDGMAVDEAALRKVDHSGRIVKWEPENGWKLNESHTITVTRRTDGKQQTLVVHPLGQTKGGRDA